MSPEEEGLWGSLSHMGLCGAGAPARERLPRIVTKER